MSEPNATSRFLSVLRQTQWLAPEALAAYQRPLIERLVRHASTQTAFYPERLAPLFGGGDPATAPIDLTRWRDIPVLKRTHVIDHLDGMKARATPPDTGEGVPGKTSGTTGRRVEHLRSHIARTAEHCVLNRVYEIFGTDLSASHAFITTDRDGKYPYPDGASYRGWNLSDPESPMHVLAIETGTPELLEWLERVRPDHVSTYPARLTEVADLSARKGGTLRLKTFFATGEPLDPVSADRIVEVFGCEIIDMYAAREIGLLAFECPEAAGYHVAAETTLLELLDEDDEPAAPGTFGRVVLTSLYNYAMPFIRYDIGDVAMASTKPCPCKRGLPRLERIGGRSQDGFVWPDGKRRKFTRHIVVDIAKHLAFREVQVVQVERDVIEIRYVPDENGPAPNMAALTAVFREFFSPTASVRITPVARMERTAGMKFEQVVSLVEPD